MTRSAAAAALPPNEMLYGVKDMPGCRENFLAALSRHGLGRKDIVAQHQLVHARAGGRPKVARRLCASRESLLTGAARWGCGPTWMRWR